MKIFYGVLIVTYVGWFVWYGGHGEPVTEKELASYIALLHEKSSSTPEKQADIVTLMKRLAESDSGNEFLMVNLMKYREKAIYPPDSEWGGEVDAMAADARYASGVIKELLVRGSLPILKASTTGVFIIDEDWREWDDVAIVRYRSVRDMLDMIVGMADSGLAVHKFASIEQTHVFPTAPVISLFSLRLLFALLLFTLATLITLLVRKVVQRY